MKAFRLVKGKTSLTTGTIERPIAALCNVAGTITVTWRYGATDVVTAVEGMVLDLFEVDSVTVTTGTWSFN